MQFLAPSFLSLLWLALIPLVLYLFRRKSRSVRVSTLLFFKSLAREHQESAWLRRLKRLLSLLLTLLLLAAPIFALARLVMAPQGEAVRSVVIALDRSASMAALDSDKRTRFEAARAELRARLDALPESVPVALIAFDARPEILHAKTTNRRGLLRALDDATVRPIEDNLPAALVAANRIAALEAPSEVWLVNDRGVVKSLSPEGESDAVETNNSPVGGVSMSPGVQLRLVNLALPGPVNAGITAFDVKKIPLLHSRYQAYVQVALSADASGGRTIVVEPQVGGVPLARREFQLEPGQSQGITLDLDAAQQQIFEVSVQAPDDCLDLDNRAVVRLPVPRPLVVAWFSARPDPFTELALKSLAQEGEVEVLAGSAAQWPPSQKPDVVLFDGWLPDPWPTDVAAVVIDPPGTAVPVRAVRLQQPVPRDTVRPTDEQHPVLFRVSSGRVALTQTSVLDASSSLQPLWLAGENAVLLAGEHGGQRLVVMGFAPALSEQLPLTPSYPLLLGNALFWCAEATRLGREPQLVRTGAMVEMSGPSMEWREVRDNRLGDPVRVPVASHMVELDRIGLWRSVDGGAEGASLLLSRSETDLPGGGASSNQAAITTAFRQPALGDLTWFFLWLVALLLLLDNWLFHRHALG
ncbi:MAG: vWA domain-containing protein [Verrucomicrobiales bacterium]